MSGGSAAFIKTALENPKPNSKKALENHVHTQNLTSAIREARFYDPDLGRFLQVDPAREFWNSYSYVGNNPIFFVDPNGESATIYLRFETNSFTQSQKSQILLGIKERFIKAGIKDVFVIEDKKTAATLFGFGLWESYNTKPNRSGKDRVAVVTFLFDNPKAKSAMGRTDQFSNFSEVYLSGAIGMKSEMLINFAINIASHEVVHGGNFLNGKYSNDQFAPGSLFNPIDGVAKKGFIMQTNLDSIKEAAQAGLQFDPEDAKLMKKILND